MKKQFYKWLFFKMMGWKIEGAIDPNVKKCVMMVMPHTSAHDFYLGIFTRGITGLEMNFVAKKELFRFPFASYFKYMGGAPLDRTGGLNKVDSIARIFSEKEILEFCRRFDVAKMLLDKKSYQEIEKKTNMSSTTIARISKFLH